jgi:hypothetical protein
MKVLATVLSTVTALAFGAFLAGSPMSASLAAQTAGAGQAAGSGQIPRTPWDGKPDLSGVWGPASFGPGPNHDPRQTSPEDRRKNLAELDRVYQPWALERSKSLKYLEDPRYHCGPYGFPKYVNLPDYFLLQVVQAPKETLVFVEYIYSGFRVITSDGSPHSKNPTPSFFGDSVGRWEEDTFVVDVTGFNGKIWLPGDGGRISSDALHQVERWRLLDRDTLEYSATVEDPKVLTGPWTAAKSLFKRAPPDIVPHEAMCLDPQDYFHMKATEDKSPR